MCHNRWLFTLSWNQSYQRPLLSLLLGFDLILNSPCLSAFKGFFEGVSCHQVLLAGVDNFLAQYPTIIYLSVMKCILLFVDQASHYLRIIRLINIIVMELIRWFFIQRFFHISNRVVQYVCHIVHSVISYSISSYLAIALVSREISLRSLRGDWNGLRNLRQRGEDVRFF